MDNQTVLNIIEVVITSIIVPLLAWGVKALVDWLKSKTENATLEKYIDFASNAVELAVKQTTQTYVDSLKKQGAFNEAAQKEAFNKTLATAKTLLTEKAQEAITTVYGDVNEWLSSKIESTVATTKGTAAK